MGQMDRILVFQFLTVQRGICKKIGTPTDLAPGAQGIFLQTFLETPHGQEILLQAYLHFLMTFLHRVGLAGKQFYRRSFRFSYDVPFAHWPVCDLHYE